MSLAKNDTRFGLFSSLNLFTTTPLHALHHCFSLLYEYSWCLWNTTLYKSVASTGSIESIQHLYHDTIVQRVRSLQFKSVNDSTPVGPVLRWDDHSCEYSSGPLNNIPLKPRCGLRMNFYVRVPTDCELYLWILSTIDDIDYSCELCLLRCDQTPHIINYSYETYIKRNIPVSF